MSEIRSKAIQRWREKITFRQILLLTLIFLSIEAAFINTPGVGDRNRWLLYMELARIHGIGSLYSTVVNSGVDNGSPQFNLFNGDHFKSLQAVIGGVKTDYPPLGIILLGMFSRFADIFSISDFLAVKIAISLFMFGCAYIAAIWGKMWHPLFALSVFTLLVPNGLMLSYVDSFFLFFFLLGLYYFDRGKKEWGVVFFALSCFIKWQPIILAPFILLLVLPHKIKTKDWIPVVPGILVAIAVYAIFGNDMLKAFARGAGEDHLSSLGLNLNWIYTGYIEFKANLLHNGRVDSLLGINHYPLVHYGSRILAYSVYILSLIRFYRSDRSLIQFIESCILVFLGYGMFYTNVHENHLLLPAVLGLFWAFYDRTRILDAVMLALMVNLNMFVFFGSDGHGYQYSRLIHGVDITIFLALFNVLYSMWLFLDRLFWNFRAPRFQPEQELRANE